MPYAIRLCIFALMNFAPGVVFAWSATGHHVIASLAFDQLDEAAQIEMMRILDAHPDYAKRFNAPKSVTDQRLIDLWRIGIAGCWPDIIRDTDADRPTWHYELGASVVLGDPSATNVPEPPGPLPADATMNTQELYLSQAFELCRKVFSDNTRPDAERAVALCWIIHLLADGHQPCHAGSLYAAKIFPDGDRGANSIRIGRGNLHSTWDGLLGGNATAGNVINRVKELKADTATVERVVAHRESFGSDGVERWIDSSLWLTESQTAAKRFVYSPEILEPVTAAMRGLVSRVELQGVSTEYGTAAGKIARIRATQAGFRLAAVLTRDLNDNE